MEVENLKKLVELDILKNHKIDDRDNLICCCPFHDEINPSFGINIKTGKYNCFSAKCGESGKSFKSFFGKIAEHHGVTFNNEINPLTVNEYIQSLEVEKNEVKHIEYLEERILSKYSLELGDYINKRISNKDIQKLFEIRYDRLNNRYVIPIRHWNEKLMGVVYRQFVEPKYKYSYGLNKSLTLFGIDKVVGNKGIITEGQFDVINYYDKGFKDCVGIMGSKMSREQEKLILQYFNEIIIATDNDEAGRVCADDMRKRLEDKIEVKSFQWITGKSDLGELSKEEIQYELESIL